MLYVTKIKIELFLEIFPSSKFVIMDDKIASDFFRREFNFNHFLYTSICTLFLVKNWSYFVKVQVKNWIMVYINPLSEISIRRDDDFSIVVVATHWTVQGVQTWVTSWGGGAKVHLHHPKHFCATWEDWKKRGRSYHRRGRSRSFSFDF